MWEITTYFVDMVSGCFLFKIIVNIFAYPIEKENVQKTVDYTLQI